VYLGIILLTEHSDCFKALSKPTKSLGVYCEIAHRVSKGFSSVSLLWISSNIVCLFLHRLCATLQGQGRKIRTATKNLTSVSGDEGFPTILSKAILDFSFLPPARGSNRTTKSSEGTFRMSKPEF
jgi:hypothetical protein